MLSPIEHIFFSRPHRVCQKWRHFLPIYERYFSCYRDTRVKFLEFGVSQGGSLDIWLDYFGRDAQIIGVDINPYCKRFQTERIQIFIGDQSDPSFLSDLAVSVGQLDVVLDDGGHRMDHQINSFEALFPQLRNGGVYICEDTHTSYQEEFGGGLQKPGSFIEYMKNLIDHSYFSNIKGKVPTQYTRFISSITFFNSMVVIEKGHNESPLYVEVGV